MIARISNIASILWRAVVNFAKAKRLLEAKDFESITGKGVVGTVNGKKLRLEMQN
jgi:Cu2+-exporting ATPase